MKNHSSLKGYDFSCHLIFIRLVPLWYKSHILVNTGCCGGLFLCIRSNMPTISSYRLRHTLHPKWYVHRKRFPLRLQGRNSSIREFCFLCVKKFRCRWHTRTLRQWLCRNFFWFWTETSDSIHYGYFFCIVYRDSPIFPYAGLCLPFDLHYWIVAETEINPAAYGPTAYGSA